MVQLLTELIVFSTTLEVSILDRPHVAGGIKEASAAPEAMASMEVVEVKMVAGEGNEAMVAGLSAEEGVVEATGAATNTAHT
jgi:hypothetical protein